MKAILGIFWIALASGCAKTVTICREYGSMTICRDVNEEEHDKRGDEAIEEYKKIQKRELQKLLSDN